MKTVAKHAAARALLGLMAFSLDVSAETLSCPPPISCAPCGEVITNVTMPSYDSTGVQPIQNYVATYESCIRGGANGIYFGTGFGYGTTNYRVSIPNLAMRDFSNSYITEFVALGFAHAKMPFFIGGELGWYYNSLSRPFSYVDTSSFVFTFADPAPGAITQIPGNIRLDINAQNHVAFDLLPGFALSPRFAFFARIGVEYTNYAWLRRICFPQTLIVTDAGIITNVDVNGIMDSCSFGNTGEKQTDSIVDYRVGAGVSYAAGPHVSFNLSVLHIAGSKAKFTPHALNITTGAPTVLDADHLLPVDGTLVANSANLLAKNTINPSRNEVLLGVAFSF